jgi:site-specific DNA-methyltransferase (adenine-specific)
LAKGSWNENGTHKGRNKRSVWTVNTHGYKDAHFATFPPKLIEPMILAGSRVADVVLDPFIGSGATAMVAKRLGRHYVGIDLKADYLKMAMGRITSQEVCAL